MRIAKKSASSQAVKLNKNKPTQTIIATDSLCCSSVQTEKDINGVKKDTSDKQLQEELSLKADLDKFAQKLDNHKQCQNFFNCICALSNGSLPFTNLVWKGSLKWGLYYHVH